MSRSCTSVVKYPAQNERFVFRRILKRKSSLMMFQRFGNMKLHIEIREFWCKGYYVDTVGKNTTAIKEYIANQLERDKEMDQLVLFEPKDPFMGASNNCMAGRPIKDIFMCG